MWDLDQIIRNNNQAAVEYMMRGQKADEIESAIPAAWTLERVAARLRIGPPALSELMNCCMDFQKIQAFLELIRQYLPEHEEEILSQPRDQRLHRFCYLFGKRYFQLPASAADNNLGNFVVGMPVLLAGMSHNVYHDLELHPGYLLLLSLVVYPYAGCEMDDEFGFENKHKTRAEQSNGPRIPLLDKVQNLVGAEMAKRIPEGGWDPGWLRQETDGTKYDGVGAFADWACSRTGCVVLDFSYADCSYIEGDGEPVFLWTRGNVDMLTEEWPRVKQVRGAIDRIVAWLEADMERRFAEILSFLLSQKQPRPKKQTYYDECDHFCPLEQASRDDYDELENEDVEQEAGPVQLGGA